MGRLQPIDTDELRRGHSLVEVAAASVKLIRTGREWKACCPFHRDRSPSFTIYDEGRRFQCFGCGAAGDVIDFVRRLHGVDFLEAAQMIAGGALPAVEGPQLPAAAQVDRSGDARAIWEASQAIGGTVGERYLHSRGLRGPWPESLRFARLAYGRRGPPKPVLIAAVHDVQGSLCGVQRTYLAPDGYGKAAVPKPKLSLGRVAGGAIRLAPQAARLVVCEGVEDGLTLQQELGRAVWVAAGASMLPAMQFPDGAREIIIGADNDAAGSEAASKATQAFAARGLTVRIIRPLEGFKDFNDELKGSL